MRENFLETSLGVKSAEWLRNRVGLRLRPQTDTREENK